VAVLIEQSDKLSNASEAVALLHRALELLDASDAPAFIGARLNELLEQLHIELAGGNSPV
jgi:hypothetical protein